MEKDNKSQLAEDLGHALYLCRLRDDLSELAEDKTITDVRVKKALNNVYLKAVVLLACAIVDSKHIQSASGKE
jgi:hypothetical protein